MIHIVKTNEKQPHKQIRIIFDKMLDDRKCKLLHVLFYCSMAMLSSLLANHQNRHQATHKVGSLLMATLSSTGVCVDMHGLTYSLYPIPHPTPHPKGRDQIEGMLSSLLANHQSRHQATHKVGDCRWPLNLTQGYVWVCMNI